MANAKLEDLTKWLPKGENPKIAGIEMCYTKMKEKAENGEENYNGLGTR